jgi:hypothetical protein
VYRKNLFSGSNRSKDIKKIPFFFFIAGYKDDATRAKDILEQLLKEADKHLN